MSAAKAASWRDRRERGSPWLLKLMAALSLRLGRTLSRPAVRCVAAYYCMVARDARRASQRYLRRALGRAPRRREVFRHVLHFATTIHDRVFLLNAQDDRFRITIEGEALMRAALRGGRGAFLMGAHMGSFEVLGSIGRRQPGLHVTMAMFEDNARKIKDGLGAVNPRAAPDIIALGRVDAMLQIAQRLDAGAFVGVLADRTLGAGPVQEVVLLGAPAELPVGPMRIAALLRRPVIFMVGLYRGGNRYHVVFEQVADFSQAQAGSRDDAVRTAVERYAALLERYCRSDPYNWFNFFDFWREDGSGRDARPAA